MGYRQVLTSPHYLCLHGWENVVQPLVRKTVVTVESPSVPGAMSNTLQLVNHARSWSSLLLQMISHAPGKKVSLAFTSASTWDLRLGGLREDNPVSSPPFEVSDEELEGSEESVEIEESGGEPSSQVPHTLRPGDILITYHPCSKRDARVMGCEEFKEGLNKAGSIEPPEEEPWHPFCSREDFEFAEIVHDVAMNQSQIDALIKFTRHCQGNPGKFTLNSFHDLRKSWEDLSMLLTGVSTLSSAIHRATCSHHTAFQFECHKLKLEYDGVERQFETWSRPLWGWVMDHLKNPDIVRQFEWDAQRVERYNGEEFTRVYTEPWTGDRFWEIQVGLDGSVLGWC